MNMLDVYNNRTQLSLSADDIKKAQKIIKDTVFSISFLSQRLTDGADMNDVHTHMSLLEHSIRDLSPLLHYDSVLAEEAEKRYAEIRTLNQKVRELENQRGREVTAEAVSAALRGYENDFSAWYEAHGFRYANTSYTAYGLRADFSSELNHTRRDSLTTSKELFKVLEASVPFITESHDWDIYRDHYHSEVLDTDRNRKNFVELFKNSFPDARILSFSSRVNDFDSFSLRCEVNVPYTDIQRMTLLAKQNKTQ